LPYFIKTLEEKRRGVLKTSGHFLFKTHIRFSPIIHKVGVMAQQICLLSEYLRSQQIFCGIFPTLKSIGEYPISVLKR
jgi:hypothetical protein